MPSGLEKIYTYHLADQNGKATVSQALGILRPFLPTSLHLYRRLQIGRFFQSTVLLTNLPSLHAHPPSTYAGAQWYIAFLDRASRPETQFWIFSSWETDPNPSSPTQKSIQNDLIKTLLQHIKSKPLPESQHQDFLDAEAAKSQAEDTGSKYTPDFHNNSIVLLGAVHEKTADIIQRQRLDAWGEANYAYIFSSLPDSLPAPSELPKDLHWGELQCSDYVLVRSRTQIPRQTKTLAILPHLAILTEDNTPVAWAFVGIDGSLTTLHVEEDYRGQGLAKAITVKLFKEKMGGLWEDEVDKMAHGYVMVGNDASSAVCTSLGGKPSWKVLWIRADLERV